MSPRPFEHGKPATTTPATCSMCGGPSFRDRQNRTLLHTWRNPAKGGEVEACPGSVRGARP